MVNWAPATVTAVRRETVEAVTLVLGVEAWPGHIAGQHLDVRLTAEDGYTAVRSYSIASSADSAALEITVDRLDDGEVSPYLVDEVVAGDQLEIRGPTGGWFLWHRESTRAVQLIGGGSGLVPLMSMIRTHGDTSSAAPFRLLYSVRSPALELFPGELRSRSAKDSALAVSWAYTRETPGGWPYPAARLDREQLERVVFAPDTGASFFVCGSTPFVESVANWLVDAGHAPANIRTERYGGISTTA